MPSGKSRTRRKLPNGASPPDRTEGGYQLTFSIVGNRVKRLCHVGFGRPG